MTPLPVVTLRTKTPCCGRRVRIEAIIDIPREIYYRVCGECRQAWTVERREGAHTGPVRVDLLEWAREAR